MNRKIAFRAWDKENKVMYEVKKVDFSEQKVFCKQYYLNDWKFSEIELMQYTGLKDKNGKKIFEGDIIEWINYTTNDGMKNITVIEYDDKDASFYIGSWYDRDFPDTSKEALILGNIYENPELLNIK